MRFKIDTREKFHVITIKQSQFAANMTAELDNCLLRVLEKDVKNVVLNMEDIQMVDDAAAEYLVKVQQRFYEQNVSFVVCCLRPGVEDWLDKKEMLELMNVTPTESEAWDVVQMEEIEREFLSE